MASTENLIRIGGAQASPRPPAAGCAGAAGAAARQRRPEWLRIRLATPDQYRKVKQLVDGLNLHTVCQEARCPNIYECWGEHGTATFMILGDICTRRCGFCAVTSGRPNPGVDADEPENVARAVETMGLRHAVITSVDRDDLEDGGSGHFAATIRAIKRRNTDTAVEVLTPDFRRVDGALDIVLGEGPEVFSHNMETVPRLYRAARPGSRFERSLDLLREAARRRDAGEYAGRVKTGLMVGLGESDEELEQTIRDIRDAGVEVLTVGQYLQPTRQHLPVDRYVTPERFAEIRRFALDLGYRHCESGPLVRSSYHAHEHV
ncbi:MAG: lipoyl synthase [Acidobacteria bacterium]|nr:MAG: lipoyl synthase [Acidobacteriota bacterium]REK07837.1 MAG: lipoyl synthase [Acidobacteriota bacterium]